MPSSYTFGDDGEMNDDELDLADLTSQRQELHNALKQLMAKGNDIHTAVAICANDHSLPSRLVKSMRRFNFTSVTAREKEMKTVLREMVSKHRWSQPFKTLCLQNSGKGTIDKFYKDIDQVKWPPNTVLWLIKCWYERKAERVRVFAVDLAHMPEDEVKTHLKSIDVEREKLNDLVVCDVMLVRNHDATFTCVKDLFMRSLDPRDNFDIVNEYQVDRTLRVNVSNKIPTLGNICSKFQLGQCSARGQPCPLGLLHLCAIDFLPHGAKWCWKLNKNNSNRTNKTPKSGKQ